MLIPQGTGPESNRAMEVSKEDDFVQKAFSAITHKDGLPEQLEDSQVCRTQIFKPSYLYMFSLLPYDHSQTSSVDAWPYSQVYSSTILSPCALHRLDLLSVFL